MSRINVQLTNRVFVFAVDTQKFLTTIPQNNVYKEISAKLSNSSIYMSGVCEDANKVQSNSDFIWKIDVILQNLDVCNFNIRILANLLFDIENIAELKRLLAEAIELKTLFTALKENIGETQKEEAKPKIIPHLGKFTFLTTSLLAYLFYLTNNGFILGLTIISSSILVFRIINLLFRWEPEDIKR
ncbi:MAG: hypothetical protein KF721_15990 [Ignavibacteriaceae bacterium]|nr:hypothetical protein [Ignavibacteriaceae bacterium]